MSERHTRWLLLCALVLISLIALARWRVAVRAAADLAQLRAARLHLLSKSDNGERVERRVDVAPPARPPLVEPRQRGSTLLRPHPLLVDAEGSTAPMQRPLSGRLSPAPDSPSAALVEIPRGVFLEVPLPPRAPQIAGVIFSARGGRAVCALTGENRLLAEGERWQQWEVVHIDHGQVQLLAISPLSAHRWRWGFDDRGSDDWGSGDK